MLVNPRGFRRRFISTRARCPADTGATVWSHFGLKVETHEFAPRRDDEWVGGRLFHAEPLGDLSEVVSVGHRDALPRSVHTRKR